MAADYRTLKMALLADTSKFTTGLSKAQRDTQTFGGKMKSIAKGIGTAFTVAGTAIAGFATKLAIDGVKAYSDFAESSSKVNVIFGKSAETIQDWSKTAAKAFGQSRNQALDAAAQFAVFGKSAGLQGNRLANFSKKLTVLASDLASFNNTSPEEAITAIGAALRGESEPIRKYGVLLNDATLKARAFNLGLYSGKGNLEMAAKVQAAYGEILSQTSDAQGDFSRTSDGLANGQRTLNALWQDAQLTIGEALYPTITKMVNYLTSEKGQKMIKDFAEAFAESMKAVAKVLPGIVNQITKVVTAVSKQGLVAGLLSDPKIAAAALAWGAGTLAGGPAGGAIAALAAYAAAENIQSNYKETSVGYKDFVPALKNKIMQDQANNPLPGLAGLGGGQDYGYGFSGTSISSRQVQNQRNNIVININGAADSRESARAIQRVLDKIELNGGSLVGIQGFK